MITINYISVKNDINGVSSKDCQALIDLLFERKEHFFLRNLTYIIIII